MASTGAIGSGCRRSATTNSTRSPNGASRSRAASTIRLDPSSATTWPRGSRSASSSVTRPLPQPASSTRSSPRSGSRSSTAGAPARHRVGDAVVRPGVPLAGHRQPAAACRFDRLAARAHRGRGRPKPAQAEEVRRRAAQQQRRRHERGHMERIDRRRARSRRDLRWCPGRWRGQGLELAKGRIVRVEPRRSRASVA